MEEQTTRATSSVDSGFDRLNKDWYIDKAVQVLVFIGGISAIIFIIGIFIFISREGFGFLVETFDFSEFFGSTRWKPTSEYRPTYGILALIAGTASTVAMLSGPEQGARWLDELGLRCACLSFPATWPPEELRHGNSRRQQHHTCGCFIQLTQNSGLCLRRTRAGQENVQ